MTKLCCENLHGRGSGHQRLGRLCIRRLSAIARGAHCCFEVQQALEARIHLIGLIGRTGDLSTKSASIGPRLTLLVWAILR
jgi:hypothetical protein